MHAKCKIAYKEDRIVTCKLGEILKRSILFLTSICICIAHEHGPRHVVIGGQIITDLTKENDPLKLLATPNRAKPTLHHSPGYKELFIQALFSPSEPLCPDLCITCATCLIGTCMTHTSCPQTAIPCNITANCITSCLLFGYWMNDLPKELTTAALVKKIKADVKYYLCCGTNKYD